MSTRMREQCQTTHNNKHNVSETHKASTLHLVFGMIHVCCAYIYRCIGKPMVPYNFIILNNIIGRRVHLYTMHQACVIYSLHPLLLLLLYFFSSLGSSFVCVTFLLYCYVVLILWFKGLDLTAVTMVSEKAFSCPSCPCRTHHYCHASLLLPSSPLASAYTLSESLGIRHNPQRNTYRYHTEQHVKKIDLKLSSFCLSSLCVCECVVLTDAWNLLPVVLGGFFCCCCVVSSFAWNGRKPLQFLLCIYDNSEYCDECVMLIIFPFRNVVCMCDMNSIH